MKLDAMPIARSVTDDRTSTLPVRLEICPSDMEIYDIPIQTGRTLPTYLLNHCCRSSAAKFSFETDSYRHAESARSRNRTPQGYPKPKIAMIADFAFLRAVESALS